LLVSAAAVQEHKGFPSLGGKIMNQGDATPGTEPALDEMLLSVGVSAAVGLVKTFLAEDAPAESARKTSGSTDADPAGVLSSDMTFPAFDTAELNLRLAEGLSGSEDLDIDTALRQLDAWAELVGLGIANMTPRFERSPEEFDNSWPYFQYLVMATVLGRNLGVEYRPELMADPVDWSDSRSRFLHGPLTGYGGTCASMPVLYVSLGRRLGWPVCLVKANQHLFVRWRDDECSLNLEATSHGLNCHSDEHYREWPVPIKQQEIDRGWYLRNLTPRDELSLFLIDRALCLRDQAPWEPVLQLAHLVNRLLPDDPNYNGFLASATVMYGMARGLARYEMKPGAETLERVVDQNGSRRPEPRESWAVPLERIALKCSGSRSVGSNCGIQTQGRHRVVCHMPPRARLRCVLQSFSAAT
jgi:hypothetical protein